MATIKGIFEPFERYVKKQLRLRRTILAARESFTSRPDLFFTYTTAKTCTIRMASGVNLRPPAYDEEVNPLLDPVDEKWGHGSGMAEKYILEGGTKILKKIYNDYNEGSSEQEENDPEGFNKEQERLKQKVSEHLEKSNVLEDDGKKTHMVYNYKTKQWDVKNSELGAVYDSEGNMIESGGGIELAQVDIDIRSEFKYSNREGIDPVGGAYGDKSIRANWDGDFGIVPMPGITDAQIRTKSDDGSLREAQVNFVCHNRRQLEILEALYMRPGYPILLEWGWNPYISNSTTIEEQKDVLKDFFDEKSDLSSLNNAIRRRRENSGGNYDGFVGYCKNFSFQATESGGYECTTEIIAHGEILESLKAREIIIPNRIDSEGKDDGVQVEDSMSLVLKSIRANLNKKGDQKYARIKGTSAEDDSSMLETVSNFFSSLLSFEEEKEEDGKNLSDVKKLNSVDDIYVNSFALVVDVIKKVMKVTSKELKKELEEDSKTQTRGHDYLLFGTILKETVKTQEATEEDTGLRKSLYIRWDLLCQLINFIIADGYKTNHESLTELTYLNKNQRTYTHNDEKDKKGQTKGRVTLPESVQPFYLEYSAPGKKSVSPNMEELNNILGQSFDPSICLMPHQDMFKNALFQKSSDWTPEKQEAIDVKEEEEHQKTMKTIETVQLKYASTIAGLSETRSGTIYQPQNVELYQIEGDLSDEEFQVAFADIISENEEEEEYEITGFETDIEGTSKGDQKGNMLQKEQDLAENFKDMTSYEGVKFSENSIGMVYFNLEHLIATYESMAFEEYSIGDEKRTRTREKFGIFDFVTQIWKDVNKACGDYYDFNLHTEHHRPHVARIIDMTVEGDIEPKTIFKFDPQGIGSVSRDFNFSSKISSDIASTISIAAQSPNNKDSLEALSFKAFHKNIKSRFTDDVYDPDAKNQIQENAKIELERDLILYEKMITQLARYQKWSNNQYRVEIKEEDAETSTSGVGRSNVNAKKAISLAKDLERLANKINQRVPLEDKDGNKNDGKEDRPFAGMWNKNATNNRNAIIPLEFDIQLDGISGIVPLQLFQINPEKLPLGYQRPDIAFIVKGETQKITAGNDWVTEINGQLTLLNTDPPEGKNPVPNAVSKPTIKKTEEEEKANEVDKKNDPPPPEDEKKDPAPLINPSKIGQTSWNQTPLFKKNKMQLRSILTYDNGIKQLINDGTLVEIGDSAVTPNKFAPPNPKLQSVKLLKGKYYLHKDAAQSFTNWMDELDKTGINYKISSAVRFGKNTGGGSHGAGLAVDFNNLYQLVGGSIKAEPNLKARIEQPIYRQIAEIGAKYNWFNPWRLSDNGGEYEEIWHFEYWG